MAKQPSKQGTRGAVFPLRIAPAQYQTITEAAGLSGESIATFIRTAAIKSAERKLAREQKKAA
jgi:uncharacterized protein (DUF1778 family)